VKKILLSVWLVLLGVSFAAVDVQAKRLGGGGTSGMQRQAPARQAPASPPPQQAANPATAGAAAATPKRSWMGPLAGLAAGLGIAALMSHLGLSEEFGNLLMIALLAFVALMVVRMLMRRASPAGAGMAPQGMQYAGAGNALPPAERPGTGAATQADGGAGVSALPAALLPAGFDAPAFERIAKLIFIRMQAANDKADLEDLRQFATPEMFAVFKLDLQDRRSAAQQTDVVQLDAEVIDFAQEANRQIVSVRFHGLIREEKDGMAEPFDEIWHLVKPTDGSREWAIAGIAQNAVAA
jgi:predicted lipid-binding transport protein (Tim44 family)